MQQTVYRNHLLGVLTVILAFNSLDGIALGILLQDIKLDLSLSDTQLGLLSGMAFALFYSTMGIPIARWADRGNRVAIITLTTAVWSAAVVMCGAAQNFAQLVMTRIVVASGEAGCMPSALSLVSDYFKRSERPRAVSRYMLGRPVGVAISYLAAGWLNAFFNWRVTFVILGLPGLVLAAVAWFTLKEPRLAARQERQKSVHEPASPIASLVNVSAEFSLRDVCAALWANTSFRHLLLCHSVWYFFGYGLLQWTPSFFIRSFGLSTAETGTWFFLVYGLGGILGVFVGGEIATRYAAEREQVQLNACAVAFTLFAVLNAFAYLANDHRWAMGALALAAFGGNMVQGPILATIQTLVPPRMRAMSVALTYLFANMIGMGLGPLAAGALSDALQPSFGQESLRYSLLILSPGYLWAATHLLLAGRTILRDLNSSEVENLVSADSRR